MFEIVLCVAAVIWVIGWLSQVAFIDRNLNRLKVESAPGVIGVLRIVMFFTWPYWYFYNKD